MAHYVYILYSPKLDRFYIVNTELSPLERLIQHNNAYYNNPYTAKGIPWNLYHYFECNSRKQARNIELHIKNEE